jgi:hypothetical protein
LEPPFVTTQPVTERLNVPLPAKEGLGGLSTVFSAVITPLPKPVIFTLATF